MSDSLVAGRIWRARALSRRAVGRDIFELEIERPESFAFLPGQHIRLRTEEGARDYSLANAPGEACLRLWIRAVAGGTVSARLARVQADDPLEFTGPSGQFLYRPTDDPAVFVATGTGIAPFASMAASGVSEFALLYGARERAELDLASALRSRARLFVPCLSRAAGDAAGGEGETELRGGYAGRVTRYMERELPAGRYDFYLCGAAEMIQEAIAIADARFPQSRIFAEAFD